MSRVYWHPLLNARGESLGYDSSMIRIAISLAAYQAIASTIPQDRAARPPEPLEVVRRGLVD